MTLLPADDYDTLRGCETMLEEVVQDGLRRLVISQADGPLEGMLLTALARVIAVRASLADVRLGWDEHHIPEDDPDLSGCAYYRRYHRMPDANPEAACSYSCGDEPACITNEPIGGWPGARLRDVEVQAQTSTEWDRIMLTRLAQERDEARAEVVRLRSTAVAFDIVCDAITHLDAGESGIARRRMQDALEVMSPAVHKHHVPEDGTL